VVGRSYLKPVQLELELLLLIKELLQPVGQDDVRIVQATVLLVELVILVAALRRGLGFCGVQLLD
jgi:hypothetical protein